MAEHLVYILLGSNLGNKSRYLVEASIAIANNIGTILAQSSKYRTAAWGKTDQPAFYNQIILVKTSLTPQETLKSLLKIETQMGRIRTEKMGPRTIDLDILYFGSKVVNKPQLQIPHPEIQNRKFVLKPLVELAPDFIHPILKLSNKELLKNCTDPLMVTKLPGTSKLK